MNLYFKPYAACRWAQPGVDSALAIMSENRLDHENKFLWLAVRVIGTAKAKSLANLIWNFDQEEKLAKLIDLCIRN
ncbi:MAG: hypothetical protein PF693_05225 [Spirochaetia bacterium]|jgi:2-methylcitrate dehydratase PrpD|nr:hypothetical protein [Spirochaetia bacterium]